MVEYYILCQIKTSRYVPIKLVNIVLYIYIYVYEISDGRLFGHLIELERL